MQTLPPPIRSYLAQGRYTSVAKNLMMKHRLRIDQAGILEREIMLLLMGIENPDEFTQSLAEEAKLDEQTINGIVQDVNEQIFIPLREEMRRGEQKPQQSGPAAPVAPRATILPPRTTVIPANPQMPSRPPEAFVSVPKYAPPPKYFKLQNKIPPPAPPPPKPLGTDRLLEDHEEPHIEFHNVPSPGPRMAPPRPSIARQPTSEAGPPPNLPGAMPPPRPAPPSPAASPSRPKTSPPPAEGYSADPYREPIE
ncbi:TPA: hypothetical protein DIV48_03460 [Candidatus Kaiserbacteria bacterium]|nr:hypothetical protein [Candidatus Kaiserbacteria bacterium]